MIDTSIRFESFRNQKRTRKGWRSERISKTPRQTCAMSNVTIDGRNLVKVRHNNGQRSAHLPTHEWPMRPADASTCIRNSGASGFAHMRLDFHRIGRSSGQCASSCRSSSQPYDWHLFCPAEPGVNYVHARPAGTAIVTIQSILLCYQINWLPLTNLGRTANVGTNQQQ